MQEQEVDKKSEIDEIDLMTLVHVVWKQRWLVIIVTGVFLLGGVVMAFLWPRTYEATATVFPVSSSSGSSLSDYAGLASLAGISLPTGGGGNSPGKTVNALLSSRLLIETLVKDMSLLDRIEVSGKTPAERERNLVAGLKAGLKTKEDGKTGVISVTFESSDPELAQELTNTLLEILDQLLVDKSFTSSQKNREQLNRQIEAQGRKLAAYQNDMAKFQRETTMLNPTAQASKIVDTYTAMIQQKMGVELQLATAQASYSADNPRITLLQTQLANLEGQIQRIKNEVDGELPSIKMAPENMIRYQNLARDLEIATKIYASLLANVEQMKLESDKDQVYIEVLDRALLPEVGKPARSMIVLVAVALGFFLAILVVYVWQRVERYREEKFGHSQ